MKTAVEIRISGIVQGIGFRPFVYREAVKNNLCGYVINNGGEVYINVEGNSHDIESFCEDIKMHHPEGSKISSFIITPTDVKGFENFKISESKYDISALNGIPSDIGMCEDCREEMTNPQSRFFMYPFTSCTKCGPRLTTIERLPYDRCNTTMKKFKMCYKCENEYTNPADRRFHAQTTCCPDCGPQVRLIDKNGAEVIGNVFDEARKLLKAGYIFAVKGIGGYHIVCDAKNNNTITELRKRKIRRYKPFAVMMRNIETVERNCFVNSKELELLTSREKPIVLLKQKKESYLSRFINPALDRIGVMLPYSGIHHLLFDDSLDTLVATSGNISGFPLITDNDEALSGLRDVADYFIIHDREIVCPADDSVVKVICTSKESDIFIKQVIRRARGYAPISINLDYITPVILACGADMKNTFCIVKEGKAYISQHIGEADRLETLEVHKKLVNHYCQMLNISPKYLACDMHPEYQTARYAKTLNLPVIETQHHHAHIAAIIAENDYKEEVIGVAFDGTGYGTDSAIWGGEFFIASLNNFRRIGHFKQVPLPGGEQAVKEPWRMAGVYLQDAFGEHMKYLDLNCTKEIYERGWQVLWNSVNARVNRINTTSAGRMFDAVSSILDICYINDYEGQASAELEAAADKNVNNKYGYQIIENNGFIVDFAGAIRDIVNDIKRGVSVSKISGCFHNTVAEIVLDVCSRIREREGINTTALGGGVFQNSLLLESTINKLTNSGFRVLLNKEVPCNDGGISFGQAAIAAIGTNKKC